MFHSKMVIDIIVNQYWSAGLKFIDLPKKNYWLGRGILFCSLKYSLTKI